MAASLLPQSIAWILFLAGVVLIIGEALAPGAHFIVLGVALLVAGLVGLFLPSSLGILAPLVLAVLVLAVTGLTLWGYRKIGIGSGQGKGKTLDSDSLRGQFGRVTERVTTSSGEIKLDDGGFNPYYQARSVDGEIEEGEEVMVVDPGGGNVLTVESVAGGSDIDRALAQGRATDADSEATDKSHEATDTSHEATNQGATNHEATDARGDAPEPGDHGESEETATARGDDTADRDDEREADTE